MSELRTFRGKGLEDVLPRIRTELGPDAIVVARREVLEGGVGGFFARRHIEVDATTPARLDVRDDSPALPDPPPAPTDFGALLEAHALPRPAAPAPPAEPARTPGEREPPTTEVEADPPTVEVEAGPEPEPAAPVPALAPLPADDPEGDLDLLVDVGAPSEAPAARGEEDAVTHELRARGLSPELALALRDEAARHHADPALGVAAALADRIEVAPPRPAPGGAAMAFVGPGGSGKTRATAALATAYATRSDVRVAVVALHAPDAGDELERLLEGTGVAVHAAEGPEDAARLVGGLRAGGLVVVDCPGVSPRDEAGRSRLAADLRALELDATYGCLPATVAPGPGRELADGLRALGATGLALTHADETTLPGAAVEVALGARLPLALVGRSTSPRAGLRPAVASELAHAVLA